MIEQFFKHDKLIVLSSLILAIGLSWTYLFLGAGMDMGMPAGMQMPNSGPVWSLQYTLTMFVMWWVMMVAMMLPSATPMILLFATVNKKAAKSVPTLIFAASYLLIWGAFSLVAVTLQWLLNASTLLDPMMKSSSHILSGGLLVIAGVYQFTPLKNACLRHCRTPMQFVMGHWKPGHMGALKMGVQHGAFCLGCCWFLMVLLFVGGVMNMLWIGGLALYVLVEKALPHGPFVGKLAGVALIVWGVILTVN